MKTYLSKVMLSAAMLLTLGISSAIAEITPARLFSDGMVLQQNAKVKFHGIATPNSPVKVTPSWSKERLTTKADSEGRWVVEMSTPSYGGPYTIAISDKDSNKTLSDILIGDVWICGGQSNMEMPVRGFAGQPVVGSIDMIAQANPKRQLRLFRQDRDWSTTLRDTLSGGPWTHANAEEVAQFSIVGYTFGDYVQKTVDIPMGLVMCCWSNSKIEPWMSGATLTEKFPDVKLPEVDQTEFGWLTGTPTLLYNAMINPWDGFPAAGVLWYQGEANSWNAEPYRQLFPAMVEDWKHIFRNDSLPFYYVQLAPFGPRHTEEQNMAQFRQVQMEMLDEMDNIYMATIGDSGDSAFIHPRRKLPVGQRLAYLALEHQYGRTGIDSDAPRIKSADFDKDGDIIIEWHNAVNGLTPTRVPIGNFEVVDAFGKVYPAEATVYNNNKVKVKATIKDPVEVRYAYHNYYESSLFNNVGIPASPFRYVLPLKKKPAIMWFDAEANIARFSNADSIDYYIDKIADLGFTHAAVCIRPISGYLLYDSKLAPKFKGNKGNVEVDFDYLGKFIEAAHRRGLKVLASMNTFCAGHNYINKGLVYEGHPEWASMVLDPDRGIIPITEQKNKYGGMVNPINPEYQDYILSVMREVLTTYPEVDGLMLDRVRYDGITADFSNLSRQEFEKYLGQKVKNFPFDILSLKKVGDQGRFEVVQGKHFNKWIEWRAHNIADFMGRARATVKDVNPDAIFATYTGAWYPSYYEVGVNFASNTYDPSADFDWATPEYKNSGYAELIDLYTTGNYYTDITIKEGEENPNSIWNETDSKGHQGSWYTVEGSCMHLRDIMGGHDVLGGVLVDQLYFDTTRLPRAIEMNLRASDGLMVFDIVHIINRNLWSEVEQGMRAGGNIN